MRSRSQPVLAQEGAIGSAEPSAAVQRFLPKREHDRWWTRAPISLAEGVTYEAWHPFVRDTYSAPIPNDYSEGLWDHIEEQTWRPGWRYEACGPYGEDSGEVWDGEGVQLRTIVSIHKPGRYPARVFYTRQWRDPDGKMFGKTALRVVVAPTFRHWLAGERWPAYSPARAAHIAWAKLS